MKATRSHCPTDSYEDIGSPRKKGIPPTGTNRNVNCDTDPPSSHSSTRTQVRQRVNTEITNITTASATRQSGAHSTTNNMPHHTSLCLHGTDSSSASTYASVPNAIKSVETAQGNAEVTDESDGHMECTCTRKHDSKYMDANVLEINQNMLLKMCMRRIEAQKMLPRDRRSTPNVVTAESILDYIEAKVPTDVFIELLEEHLGKADVTKQIQQKGQAASVSMENQTIVTGNQTVHVVDVRKDSDCGRGSARHATSENGGCRCGGSCSALNKKQNKSKRNSRCIHKSMTDAAASALRAVAAFAEATLEGKEQDSIEHEEGEESKVEEEEQEDSSTKK